jgi:hypothetical protein
MAVPRRGFRHRKRLRLDTQHRPPDSWLPTTWAVISSAAFPHPDAVLRKIGEPSNLVGGAFPAPFDAVVLFTGAQLVAGGLAANTEIDLIGNVAQQQAGGSIVGQPVATKQAIVVPTGWRAVLDGLAPLVTDLAGNRADLTPQQLGLNVIWRVRNKSVLLSPYDNINFIVAPWHQLSIRPLVDLSGGDILTATVQINSPYAQVGQVGIRLRGRFIPWDQKLGRPRSNQDY